MQITKSHSFEVRCSVCGTTGPTKDTLPVGLVTRQFINSYLASLVNMYNKKSILYNHQCNSVSCIQCLQMKNKFLFIDHIVTKYNPINQATY